MAALLPSQMPNDNEGRAMPLAEEVVLAEQDATIQMLIGSIFQDLEQMEQQQKGLSHFVDGMEQAKHEIVELRQEVMDNQEGIGREIQQLKEDQTVLKVGLNVLAQTVDNVNDQAQVISEQCKAVNADLDDVIEQFEELDRIDENIQQLNASTIAQSEAVEEGVKEINKRAQVLQREIAANQLGYQEIIETSKPTEPVSWSKPVEKIVDIGSGIFSYIKTFFSSSQESDSSSLQSHQWSYYGLLNSPATWIGITILAGAVMQNLRLTLLCIGIQTLFFNKGVLYRLMG